MKMATFLLCLSAVFLKTCGEEATGFLFAEPFTMQIGETQTAKEDANLTLSWLNLKEDSRCPKGATCVWEGRVVVSLGVNGDEVELRLEPNEPKAAIHTTGQYHVEVKSVSPYPNEGQTIAQEEYRLEIVVQKVP